MKQKILITGGAGFIGSHIVESYLANDFEVVVIDRKEKTEFLTKLPVRYYHQDINEPTLESVFQIERPDVVNHHAALIHVGESLRSPTTYTKTNVLATIRLLELAKKYNVAQFLFASSVAVYGDTQELPIRETQAKHPQSFYGLDKALAEYYIQLYSQHFITTIFRYGNVYGPRQTHDAEGGVVAIFCNALAESKVPTIYGTGEQSRDFVYVKDVAKANLLATKKKRAGLMHAASNKATTINELFQQLASIANITKSPVYAPKRTGDIEKSVLQNDRIKSLLDWHVEFELARGLENTFTFFLNK